MRKWIPNGLTIVNLSAGLMAALLALKGYLLVAAGLVLVAALFDSVEGRIARRLNVASEFGKELDSLADLLSFGIAPAIIAYLAVFAPLGGSGYLIAATFPVSGAFRLTRIRTIDVRHYYFGLPLTAAGPILSGIALFGRGLPAIFHILAVLLLSGLMISKVKIPKV